MTEGRTGQAFCNLCHLPCGSCGCRLGGCYTEEWWAALDRARAAADSLPPRFALAAREMLDAVPSDLTLDPVSHRTRTFTARVVRPGN